MNKVVLSPKAADALDELRLMRRKEDVATILEKSIITSLLLEMAKEGLVAVEVEEDEGGFHLLFLHIEDWKHEGPVHDSIPSEDEVVADKPLPPRGTRERIERLILEVVD